MILWGQGFVVVGVLADGCRQSVASEAFERFTMKLR